MTDRDSPRDRIARDVILGLYDGRYEPGQRLTEADLTERYGVSRGPVREALNRLAAMGVIVLQKDRGAQVRMLVLDEAIDILVVVQGLVSMAARIAAQRIDKPGAAEKLKQALAAMENSDRLGGSAAYATAPDTFYKVLFDIAGNLELSRIHPSLQIHLVRIQFRSVVRAVDRRDHGDYRQIAEAVLSGRGTPAEAAAKAHVARYIAALLSYKQAHTR